MIARLGLIFILISISSCGSRPFSGRPNVILISLDTLRRDAVGPQNDRESLTPNIDSFSKSAITYRAAFTTVPFTPSAHMTMLTGRHHAVHGVSRKGTRLSLSIPTIAEIVAERGYHTFGRYTVGWLKPEFGFGRGFDSYEKVEHGPTYAWRVNESAIQAIDHLRESPKPFFAFLHYYDPHSDFVNQSHTSWPYFAPPEYRARVEMSEEDFCTAQEECATQFLIVNDRDRVEVPGSAIETLRKLYHSGVKYTDQAIGEFLHHLQERGLLESSVVLITSDHGEEFREHGMFLHSQVYEESVAVPLIVRFPRGLGGGRTLRQPVDLREVFSVIEMVTRSDFTIESSIGNGLPILDDAPVVFQDKIRKKIWGLLADEWKIVVDFEKNNVELFRGEAGNGESEDLSSQHEIVKLELMELLSQEIQGFALAREAIENDGPAMENAPLTEEETKRLNALGYLQ